MRGFVRGASCDREGDAHWLLDSLGWQVARSGRVMAAARIAGFVDATFAKTGGVRRRPPASRREQLDALLAQKLSPAELRNAISEGAQLCEEQAFALALTEQ